LHVPTLPVAMLLRYINNIDGAVNSVTYIGLHVKSYPYFCLILTKFGFFDTSIKAPNKRCHEKLLSGNRADRLMDEHNETARFAGTRMAPKIRHLNI
jgi:hypothetical protein